MCGSIKGMHNAHAAKADTVHVWQVELEQKAAAVDRLVPQLAARERAHAERFVFQRDRSHYIVAHAALRGVLADATGLAPTALEFHQEDYGKPYLPGYPLHFNLSHAGSLALIAVSAGRRVGVDLEPLRDMPDALELAAQFHPAELAALRTSHPSARAFFECWTRKEAFVKANGQGLTLPLASFAVSFFPEPQPALMAGDEPIPGWRLLDLHVPGYCAALVVEVEVEAGADEPGPHITMHTWQFP